MIYDSIITAEDAKVLQPSEEIVDGIIEGVRQGSAILPLMTKLRNMTSSEATMNVLDALPMAYFVDEGVNNGRKQTTKVAWKGKKIKAEEIAVIIPMKKNVFSDSKYDLWGQVKPLVIESAYKLIDDAIITGLNKPQEWRDGLIPSAEVAGNYVTLEANEDFSKNTYKRISQAMTMVELDGYDPNALVGGVSLKSVFREGLLDTTGQPLSATSEIMQMPRVYVKNGAFELPNELLVGDFTQAVYSIREDMKFEVFETGSISDADGKIIYNLLQDDMIALRFTFRMGWEVANPTNITNSNNNTRFPFAIIKASEE